MAASFVSHRRFPAAVLALLAALLTGGCDAGSRTAPGEDNQRPKASLRIVQPRPHARIPLWEDARQLGKMEILFDIGSTRLRAPGRSPIRLLTRIDDRPPTEVHDVHTALVRKPRVGNHILMAWLVDADGMTLAEESVPFEVLP